MASQNMNPRVFISHSRDYDAMDAFGWSPMRYKEAIRRLAAELRGDGVDCRIDEEMQEPVEGWSVWTAREVAAADCVLVILSDA